MPKWKDFIDPVKVVVTYVNPVAGAVLQVAEKIFIKPVKKVNMMLDGKKSYIGVAVSFVAIIAKYLGYDVPVEAVDGVATSLAELITACGAFIASIGLIHKADKATKK